MATLRQQVAQHWRDREIARSETISDAWQVFLAYAGRGAEIILFICMAISLAQMIPTIALPDALTGAVFVVQMITLDVAGFGLTSLAKAVKRAGDEETARRAETVGTCLIIIMVVSMLAGGVSRLFGTNHDVKTWMGYLDDVLLLTRVGLTVFYGKIMHSLRDSQQHMQTQVEDERAALQEEVAQLQTTLQHERQEASESASRLRAEMTQAQSDQAATIAELQQRLSALQSEKDHIIDELSQARQSLQHASRNESSLQASISEKELSWQAKMHAAVKAAREEMQALMKAEAGAEQGKLQAEIEELKRANAQLKAQTREAVKTPVKTGKRVSSEKFDTKAFVFSCLQDNPDMKLSEIVQAAKLNGQELSEPTISRYRKEYRESFHLGQHESSAMEG
ncbi:MAG TPA: hypothetical protein VFA10_30255 [Ktedonobacteraceae bacterium]|nr:hypothetical protein [Ktedonobacteraceae bacterium]